MSLPEVMLWQRLRGGKAGVKVRRQHPMGAYVVDFFVPSARLIIEIDGEAHDRGNRPQRDAGRDQHLAANGCRVLRKDVDGVVEAILCQVESPLHRSPRIKSGVSGPPPRSGEER